MPKCASCGFECDSHALIVALDTDTSATIVSSSISNDSHEEFELRYNSVYDSGRYPNLSRPFYECSPCRKLRYQEIQEELDYLNSKYNW